MKIRRRLIGWSIGFLVGCWFVVMTGYRAWNDRGQIRVFASEVDPLASPTADYVAVTTGPNGMVYAASTDGHLHAFRRP